MHIEFLVEDSSGARLLEILLSRLIPPAVSAHTYRIHSYKGVGRIPKGLKSVTGADQRILLDRLPGLLKGYAKTSGVGSVVMVVDSDAKDCEKFLAELMGVAVFCDNPDTLFCLAVEEIEAWYLGDREAIEQAYPKANLRCLDEYDQDSVCGTWELLARAIYPKECVHGKPADYRIAGGWKHDWAEKIGPLIEESRNISPSFKKFCEGVRRLTGEGQRAR